MLIEKVKNWLKKKPQFEMVQMSSDKSYWACRLKDQEFFNETSLRRVVYKKRNAAIIEFSSDYVHVLIECKKEVLVFPDEEFDPDNYDFIWVPINDIEHRK